MQTAFRVTSIAAMRLLRSSELFARAAWAGKTLWRRSWAATFSGTADQTLARVAVEHWQDDVMRHPLPFAAIKL